VDRLLDTCGRKIEYLRVSVVDSCNLRCFYCSPDDSCKPRRAKAIPDREKLVRVTGVAVSLGIRKIRLTGGEPLLRPDITGLVRDIAAIPGITDLSLTTNGSKLARLAGPLAEAGLKRVNISLDSLNGQNFSNITRGGRLQSTLSGIKAAFAAGLLPVKINVVVMRGINDHEIEDFARMTMDRDIHVRFIEYMPMLGQEDPWRKHYLPSSEIIARCAALAPLIPLPDADFHGPARNYRYHGTTGRLGFITPVSRHFCRQCNRLRLTSDGKLRPCLFSKVEVDLAPALNSGADLIPFFHEAARQKPAAPEQSPAARGSQLGPRGMVEIGG
jgi:cyclic pyranopterin phosphate synthase